MPNASTSKRFIRRSKPRSWQSILRIAIIPLLALVCVFGLFFAEHNFQREKQTRWVTVIVTIEATHMQPIAQHALEYGGGKLYEVDVLVTTQPNATPQHQWLPVSQSPLRLPEAQAQLSALKGARCFVRWDPAHPEEKIVELH